MCGWRAGERAGGEREGGGSCGLNITFLLKLQKLINKKACLNFVCACFYFSCSDLVLHDCSLLLELCVSLRTGANLISIWSCPVDSTNLVLDLIHDLCELVTVIMPEVLSVEAFPGEWDDVVLLLCVVLCSRWFQKVSPVLVWCSLIGVIHFFSLVSCCLVCWNVRRNDKQKL